MITAIILVKAERAKVQDVAQQFLGIEGISEVYSVAGQFDLVAIARVPELQALADLAMSSMSRIGGITKTETLVAFQAFSRFDLERLFAVGQE